jgi:cell division protein FtsQ
LVRELDAGGAHYSQELSEVDISDPEDVKVIAADSNGEVLVHLGSGNYLQRYRTYVTHIQQWRQQFEKLESVDLRYDGQIIVNPDLDGVARQPALTPAAAKAAVAAGVKTAAIVNYEKYVTRPGAPVAPKSKAKVPPKAAPHNASSKPAPAKATAIKKPTDKPAALKKTSAKSVPQPSAKQMPKITTKTKTTKNDANTITPNAKSAATPHATAVAPPVVVSAGQKKPSAGISKETPQN